MRNNGNTLVMGLNRSRGNMYEFIDSTWNTCKGECPHGCSYCYMHRWGKQNPVRFDEKELKTDLGSGNFIFVGSSCDMFAEQIPPEWIIKTLNHCNKFDNTYFFQTKNPKAFSDYAVHIAQLDKFALCITLETNRFYDFIMGNCPTPSERAKWFNMIPIKERYVTIEPIIDFDLDELIGLIRSCHPLQVNIGSDSGGNNLPEPSIDKINQLIEELEKFTKVHIKKNLKR